MPSSKRKQKHRGQKHRALTPESPLEVFFAKYYPEFKYDAAKSASLEFYRLCNKLRWDRKDAQAERKEAHRKFKNALVKQFNDIYGTDKDDLRQWQNLCHIVDIYPIPDGLEACRKAIRGTYVNLVDLVDRGATGKKVQLFDSECELSEYTWDKGKFFPKKNAHAGGLLRYLLRHILNPAREVPSRHGNRKRR